MPKCVWTFEISEFWFLDILQTFSCLMLRLGSRSQTGILVLLILGWGPHEPNLTFMVGKNEVKNKAKQLGRNSQRWTSIIIDN